MALVAHLRKMGMRIHHLDDILLHQSNTSSGTCSLVLASLQKFSWVIHVENSQMTPIQYSYYVNNLSGTPDRDIVRLGVSPFGEERSSPGEGTASLSKAISNSLSVSAKCGHDDGNKVKGKLKKRGCAVIGLDSFIQKIRLKTLTRFLVD